MAKSNLATGRRSNSTTPLVLSPAEWASAYHEERQAGTNPPGVWDLILGLPPRLRWNTILEIFFYGYRDPYLAEAMHEAAREIYQSFNEEQLPPQPIWEWMQDCGIADPESWD